MSLKYLFSFSTVQFVLSVSLGFRLNLLFKASQTRPIWGNSAEMTELKLRVNLQLHREHSKLRAREDVDKTSLLYLFPDKILQSSQCFGLQIFYWMSGPVLTFAPYCLFLIDRCTSPAQASWVAMIACLFPIDLSRGSNSHSPHLLWLNRDQKKNVSEQWCHLNYAGMVDVYWEVKRCINKAWRYLRSAANRNIGPLSFCKLILLLLFFYLLIFKIFKGFQAVCKIAMVICKLEKIKEERNV